MPALPAYVLAESLQPVEYGLFRGLGYWGTGLAMNGDGTVLAIGCASFPDSVVNSGGVFTFDYVGGAWVQRGSVLLPHPASAYAFGSVDLALSADGETLVVGEIYFEDATTKGRVFVYARNGDSWTQTATINNPQAPGTADDYFGRTVAISGNGRVIVAGSEYLNVGGNNTGGLFTFDLVAGAWVQRGACLKENPSFSNCENTTEYWGGSAALNYDGSVLASGHAYYVWCTPVDLLDPEWGAGAVYVYDANGTTWTQRYVIENPDPRVDKTQSAYFGSAVALDRTGETLAIGHEAYDSEDEWAEDGVPAIPPWGVPIDTWSHVAVSKQGTTIRLFADGLKVAEYFDAVFDPSGDEDLYVYGFDFGSATPGVVRLDEVRLTVGHARYTDDFTRPLSTYISGADPLAAYVVWASHCDGTDGQKTLTDDSGNGLDIDLLADANEAELDTSQKAFGTASLLMDAESAWADIAGSISLAGADWCFECMVRTDATANVRDFYPFWISPGQYLGITLADGVPVFRWDDGVAGNTLLYPEGTDAIPPTLIKPGFWDEGEVQLYELTPATYESVRTLRPGAYAHNELTFGRRVALASDTLQAVAVYSMFDYVTNNNAGRVDVFRPLAPAIIGNCPFPSIARACNPASESMRCAPRSTVRLIPSNR